MSLFHRTPAGVPTERYDELASDPLEDISATEMFAMLPDTVQQKIEDEYVTRVLDPDDWRRCWELARAGR